MKHLKNNLNSVAISNFSKRHLNQGDFTFIPSDEKFEEIRKKTQVKINNGDYSDGYADFCKIVILNMPEIKSPIAKITSENKHLLKSVMKKRREGEEEYESVYFPGGSVEELPSDHLSIILYSKEQVEKESGKDNFDKSTGADWEIVSVNSDPYSYVTPMCPITMKRNASGIGGSGHQHTEEEFKESERFWSEHAKIHFE
jgi:Protein of unknown function (DUF3228)